MQHLWNALVGHHRLAGQHVLDIGCGTGCYLPAFAQYAEAFMGEHEGFTVDYAVNLWRKTY